MRAALCDLWKDQSGTTAVEYALMLAVMVIPAIGVWMHMQQTLTNVLDEAVNRLTSSP